MSLSLHRAGFAMAKRFFKLRHGLSLGLAFSACGGALAQTEVDDAAAAKPLQCLVRSAEAPKIPARLQELRFNSFLRVKLQFTSPDQPPNHEVLFRSGVKEHEEEMERYIRGYRLPCLKPGQRIEAVQEFVFDGEKLGGAHWNELRHSPKPRAGNHNACIQTPKQELSHFEDNALGSNIKRKANGVVLARARFTKQDAPPEVEVLYSNGNAHWRNSVVSYLADYRFTCPLSESDEAVVFEQQFNYAASTRSHDYGFKDTGIVQFLGSVKDIDKQKVRFDLDSMGCPFELAWGVGMPAFKNSVTQLGNYNPNRLEFIAWLETLSLNVSADVFDQVVGKRFKITVPCGKINLGD